LTKKAPYKSDVRNPQVLVGIVPNIGTTHWISAVALLQTTGARGCADK
jgi:hypothetical protein